MSVPTLDVAAQKRRMIVAVAVDVVCVLVAAAALLGVFAYDISWLMAIFIGAIVIGFLAQVWLILGMVGNGGGR